MKKVKDRAFFKWIAASPNIDYSVATDALFIEWIRLFDPSYKLPCITSIKLGIVAIAAEIRSIVADLIEDADRVTICIDLWTASDGTRFLGIVTHFFCKSKKKPIRLVVGCKQVF